MVEGQSCLWENHPLANLPDELYLYFDGSCGPENPGGTAAFAWIVKRADGSVVMSHNGVVCKGPGATNNVAEWHGLGRGLRFLKEIEWKGKLHIRGDSQLVINQLTGVYKCKKEHLIPLRNACITLLEDIGNQYDAEWVAREQNTEADELSRKPYEDSNGR